MLCVTFTALVQRLIAMVKAISAAAATAIDVYKRQVCGCASWKKIAEATVGIGKTATVIDS